jgi:antiviral helicase SKI2
MPAEPYVGPVVRTVSVALLLACRKLRRVALALGQLQAEAGLPVVPTEYAQAKLNFGLLLPTYAWACGVSFVQVTALTECPEGTIVRTISRLDETCREVRNAARILGDPLLFRTAETASQCIKRDVIFAQSLWL